nr:hypothetical protein [Tanacetum cinerariifolium]
NLLKGYNKVNHSTYKMSRQPYFRSLENSPLTMDYTRFYKLMNEMIIKNLTIATMQVNVQFLQHLQPEWSRNKGKEIAKPITPPSESTSKEDSDPEQAHLRTFSNTRNKNVDTTPRYKNDNQTRQFRNQRKITIFGARETVSGQVVQQTGIQCFKCKEFGHFAKECRKPKRVKDSAYHKEKMLLCKQAKKGVPPQVEQSDWLADMDEEIDEQELEAHYSYMAKIQEVPTDNLGTNSKPLEQVQNDAGYNVFTNEIQHSEQYESISNTCVVETGDSNVIPDSPDMCDNHIQYVLALKVEQGNVIVIHFTTTSITTHLLKILHHCHFIILQSFIMTTPTITSSTDSQMHNNIMAAGSRDRPPMLVTGRYPQCGPYKPTNVLVQEVAATNDSPAIPEHTIVETPMNMSPENKAHFQEEKEAIRLILTGIGDEIYSTVDACQTAQEIEIMESYDTRFYKLMNEMIRNNLTVATITSLNSRNKDMDTTPRYKNDNQSRQFRNQRTVNVAGARENVGSPIVQQSGIQCFNYKEFRHFDKECRKPKRVKDSAYHKEKMLLYKQAKQGVPLQAEQYELLADTDEEIDEQEFEAHYNYMAKIQEVPTADSGTDFEPLEHVQNNAGYNVFANDLQHSEQSESISNICLVETDDSNVIPDSPDMCENDIQNDQNDVESDDERVALANLIANLKLDVDKNKKI